MPRLKYSITNQNQAGQDGPYGRFGKCKLLLCVMQVFYIYTANFDNSISFIKNYFSSSFFEYTPLFILLSRSLYTPISRPICRTWFSVTP